MTQDPKKVKNKLAGGRKFGLTCDSPKVLGATKEGEASGLIASSPSLFCWPFLPSGWASILLEQSPVRGWQPPHRKPRWQEQAEAVAGGRFLL